MRSRKLLNGLAERILPLVGSPLAEIIYLPVVHVRNFLYDRELILKRERVPAKTISIGNLTVGGTGKTPFVIALANILSKKDYRVGIVTRGYRRKSKGEIVVSLGDGPLHPPDIAGDEPYLIAERTRNVPVVVSKDRVSAAQRLSEEYSCNVIIADDCFQHRKFYRDIDIVLWDSTIDPEGERLLPAGRLREPISSIRRADVLIFTNFELSEKYRKYYKIFRRFNKKLLVSTASKVLAGACSVAGRVSRDISILRNKRVLAFCGVGNPGQFFKFVRRNIRPVSLIELPFPDHHKYSIKDLENINCVAAQNNCQYILTTEKDFLNLPEEASQQPDIFVLKIDMVINDKVMRFVESKLGLAH